MTMQTGNENAEYGLALSGVSKSFGDKAAVSGVNLTVPRGAFFVLLGESGCGKTTLLRLIAGFEKPDDGRIFVLGRDVTDLPPGERGCRTAFQGGALFSHMSAAGNIAFALRAKKTDTGGGKRRMSVKDARSAAERALEYLGLGGMAGRKASTLSGGEAQRVAVARAAACGADVLLLDEPTGSLDAPSREELDDWLLSVRDKTGATVVCVTHDRTEAMRIGDVVGIMSGGRLLRVGTPEEVYSDPRSEEAAKLTGECGTIRGAADGAKAVFAPGVTAECGFTGTAEAYVRPESVLLGVGAATGAVTGCAYAGGRYLITVSADCGTLKAYSDEAASVGDAVKFTVKDIKAVKV